MKVNNSECDLLKESSKNHHPHLVTITVRSEQSKKLQNQKLMCFQTKRKAMKNVK